METNESDGKKKPVTTDRHRKGYWHERWMKQKAEQKRTGKNRKEYFRQYNLKHPERLARIGIFVNPDGTVTDTRGQSNTEVMDSLAHNLWLKEHQWHEDDDESDGLFGDDDWGEQYDDFDRLGV